jgi:hypothetical protein
VEPRFDYNGHAVLKKYSAHFYGIILNVLCTFSRSSSDLWGIWIAANLQESFSPCSAESAYVGSEQASRFTSLCLKRCKHKMTGIEKQVQMTDQSIAFDYLLLPPK